MLISLNHRVRAIQKDRRVITVAGQGTSGDQVGALNKVMFNQPSGVAVASGKLYVTDTLNNKLKVLSLDMQVWLDGVQVKLNSATLPLQEFTG